MLPFGRISGLPIPEGACAVAPFRVGSAAR